MGRLVPQDPDDEPAEVLLERIAAAQKNGWKEREWKKEVVRAKKKAVQAKKRAAGKSSSIRDLLLGEWEDLPISKYEKYLPKGNSWQLKYKQPAYLDVDNLPILPSGWIWASWNQVAQWVTYGFTRPMPHISSGIPIVTAKNIIDSKIDLTRTHKTPIEAYIQLSDKDRPLKGDILITKDGSIGRTATVDFDEPFCINQSVAVVWLRGSPLNRDYLVNVIQAPLTQQPIISHAKGAAIKHLSITDFGRLPFPLPPLTEQNRIVSEMNLLFDLCDQLAIQVSMSEERREILLDAVQAQA